MTGVCRHLGKIFMFCITILKYKIPLQMYQKCFFLIKKPFVIFPEGYFVSSSRIKRGYYLFFAHNQKRVLSK